MSRQAFEEVLKENRYDSTTRLVYADWLEERGFDDEAQEQRRMASPEWVGADRWMHAFADGLGETCVNYDETYRYDPVTHRVEDGEPERWEKITYDTVMKAAQESVDSLDAERWVQQGSEEARDKMADPGTREQFWAAWRVITGQTLSEDARGYRVFCCTC